MNASKDNNRFGLSRYIPSDIRRIVRQRCGFGCVICGFAFYQYEHFSPKFSEAKEHNEDGITLLCARCHNEKTVGRLSMRKLMSSIENPHCIKTGKSFGPLEFTNEEPIVQIGTTQFRNPQSIFTINGENILSIRKPNEEGEPYLLSFKPTEGGSGIENNQWISRTSDWDIEVKGRMIIVREGKRKIRLMIENLPGDIFMIHEINVEFMNYSIKSKKISQKEIGDFEIEKNKVIVVENPHGQEIARFSGTPGSVNEIQWDNILEIEGDFVKQEIDKMTINRGNFNIVPNLKSGVFQIKNVTIKGANLEISYAKELRGFIALVNKIFKPGRKINPKGKRDFKFSYRMLKHNGLINQLSPNDKSQVDNLYKSLFPRG